MFPEGADTPGDPDRGAGGDRHRLRVAGGLAGAHHADAGGLLQPRAPRVHRAGDRGVRRPGVPGRRAPDGQPRHRGGRAPFAIVGIINRAAPDDRIDDIGGLAAWAPRLAGVFLIVAMASLAIPGSNSFVGEFFILTGVFRQHLWLAVLACIGIIYAAVYMLRLYQSTMNGPAARRRRPRRPSCARRDLVLPAAAGRRDAVHRPVAEGLVIATTTTATSSGRSRRPRWPRTARPTRSTRRRARQPAGRRAAAARRRGRGRRRPPRPDGGGRRERPLNVVAATPIIIAAGTADRRLGRRACCPAARAPPRPRGRAASRGIVAAIVDVGRALGRPPGGLQRRPARRPLQPAAERHLPGGRPADDPARRGASPPRSTAAASSSA